MIKARADQNDSMPVPSTVKLSGDQHCALMATGAGVASAYAAVDGVVRYAALAGACKGT